MNKDTCQGKLASVNEALMKSTDEICFWCHVIIESEASYLKRYPVSCHLHHHFWREIQTRKVMKCPPNCTPQRGKNSNPKPKLKNKPTLTLITKGGLGWNCISRQKMRVSDSLFIFFFHILITLFIPRTLTQLTTLTLLILLITNATYTYTTYNTHVTFFSSFLQCITIHYFAVLFFRLQCNTVQYNLLTAFFF